MIQLGTLKEITDLRSLITYASGKGADVVIWVVKHAREEHKAAVEWLNNHTDDKIGALWGKMGQIFALVVVRDYGNTTNGKMKNRKCG